MSLYIALLTISDKKKNDVENPGITLEEKLTELNHNILDKKFIKDDKEEIKEILQNWLKHDKLNIIVITGGIELTGVGVVPEILKEIADKDLPTFVELTEKINYSTCAVLAKNKYIFSIPGTKDAVTNICEKIFKYWLNINYVTFINFNSNKKVTPTHLFYGQLINYRVQDMRDELDKQIEFYLSNSKTDLNEGKRKFILVEIGSYLGESLELWGDLLEKKLKNNFLIISIDPYTYYASDSDKNYHYSSADKSAPKKSARVVKMSESMNKIYMYFMNNISVKKWRDKHFHLRMNSVEAYNALKNLNIKIDFIYIDGSHYYESYKFDLENYCKILKTSDKYKGKMCGDDFEVSYSELLRELKKEDVDKIMNDNRNTDFLKLDKFYFHPGITLAMKETKNKIKKFTSGFWTMDN